MSLNWNIGRIENMDTVCYERLPLAGNEDLLKSMSFMGPGWHVCKDDPDTIERMSVTTHTLIFATMSVDMGSITEKNADEFYRRLTVVERDGAFRRSEDGPVPFTLDEVKAHIGLTTNVATMPKRAWDAKRKRIDARNNKEFRASA